VADLNNLDENLGMAPSPVNIDQGIRWNSAFAYLDAIRARHNLTIVGNAIVDRLVLDAHQAVRIVLLVNGTPHAMEAGRVVLAAGTYGSPVILMRSGIGNPEELRTAASIQSSNCPVLAAICTTIRKLRWSSAAHLRWLKRCKLSETSIGCRKSRRSRRRDRHNAAPVSISTSFLWAVRGLISRAIGTGHWKLRV
jgi:hypothetical protein